MILFFTDFGWLGPYVGEMRTAVLKYANTIPAVDLMHDAPKHAPRPSAYLLAALAGSMPHAAVCVAVVDPGVGTERDAIVLKAGNRYFVGPDNGLLSIVAERSGSPQWHRIVWRPETLSASFHGRDLFAPVAARIAKRLMEGDTKLDGLAEAITAPSSNPFQPADIDEVIYVDGFGNCVLGRRAGNVEAGAEIGFTTKDGRPETARHARTFGEVAEGEVFWYANSMGLVEIAVNKGNASVRFGLTVGTETRVI